MRVLFSTVSPAGYMRPPSLGEEQINCGPDWADVAGPDGRAISLATPIGAYDLAAVAARLPAGQEPDLVVCLVDASRRNLPGNLAAFRCPRVLLVADTHHLETPLAGMLGYAAREPFDRVVLVYDRHHAEFFRTAGVRNLFWFPGLTFPHPDAAVAAARRTGRPARIAFVGQAGRLHPRRQVLLAEMRARGLEVEQRALPQAVALEFYGASLLGFNASLNGDLNLRIFEILAAGGALLTDRLAPASGLDAILGEGREFLGYGSPEELAECAARALAHPEEAGAVGAAGARWFDEHLGEKRRLEAFRRLACDGTEVPAFAFPAAERTSVFFPGEAVRFLAATAFYEQVQELHRSRPVVRVALGAAAPAEIERMGATLPGVRCVPFSCAGDADAVVLGRGDTIGCAGDHWRVLWAPDGGEEQATVVPPDVVAKGAGLLVRTVEAEAAAKHVLLITDDPDSGGVAQYNHAILLALVRTGYRVSCIQSRADNPLVVRQRESGVSFRWIDYHTGREFGRTLEDAAVAETLFREDRPDLVLFSDCCPVSNFAARRAAQRLSIPYVVVEGFVGAYLARDFADRLGELAGQYAQARAVVAVSEENLELLRCHFGLPERRGVVIHYGRPARFFGARDAAVRARLRTELGIPAEAVVCFTAARLARVKGYACQLEAAVRLVGEAPDRRLHWVWAGGGELHDELAGEIARLGLAGRVHLLGHRWDVADWYDAADIFVLPSQLEGMPLAIMEAMAKGLPVIATAVSGIPEELGDTGKLLPSPSGDAAGVVAGLVETIQLWAEHGEVRRTAGERSRARACSLFREEQMVGKTLALVRRALAGTAESPAESPAAGLLAEARALARQGQFAPAFAKTLAAVEKDRNWAEPHALLGQLALARPNGAAMAVKSFRAALALDPGATETELRLAAALAELGRPVEAQESLARVLARNPHDLDAQRLAERLRTAAPAAAAPPTGRVLLYTDDAGVGAEAEFTNAVGRALGTAGYRVSTARARRSPVGDEATARGGRMHWIGYDTRAEPERAAADEETLARICAADRPDLVVFSDSVPAANLGAKLAAERCGLPRVILCGALAPAAPRSRGVAAVVACRLARARAVAARSPAALDVLRYECGLAPDRGVVLPGGTGAEAEQALQQSLAGLLRLALQPSQAPASTERDVATPFLHVVHRAGRTVWREFQCYAPDRGRHGMPLIEAALRELALGDCEFAVNTGDGPGPVGGLTTFSYSTADGDYRRVCPDFVFNAWPETRIDDYEALCREMTMAGRRSPESARIGWIGALLVPVRERLVQMSSEHPELLEAIPMSWDRSNPAQHASARFLSLPEQVRRWKYLLDVEGHGWSARLKTFFFSRRVVFIAERPWKEWYFEHLEPWKHFVPVRRDLGDLVENYRRLESDPSLQQALIDGAQEFAVRYLTRAAAIERWRALLLANFGRP